jgi:hypothetical protein
MADPSPTPGGAPPPVDDGVVELAYEAAVKAVEQQDATLKNLRDRAAGLLSAVAIAATFSGGLGLFSTDGANGATLAAWAKWLLFALVIATGGLSISVMWPATVTFGVDPTKILTSQHNHHVTAARLWVTNELAAGHQRNAKVLHKKFRLYRMAVLALGAEVAVLMFALILEGS